MAKRSIRQEMLARRKRLAAAECFTLSLKLQQRLVARPEFKSATMVALYSPIRNEVFTEEIFRIARAEGKRVAYPRVRSSHLEFIEVVSAADLGHGAFGVLEPTGDAEVAMDALDLLVVPGVAFDHQGHRLGYGKGFYDRALHGAGNRGRLVGLGFEFQLVTALPAEVHDVRMDLVVTEERTLECGDMASSHSDASTYI